MIRFTVFLDFDCVIVVSTVDSSGSVQLGAEKTKNTQGIARVGDLFFFGPNGNVYVVLLTCCSTMVVIMGDWEAHIQVARESSRLLKVRSAGLDMISDLSDTMARRYALYALCVAFNGIKPDTWIPCHRSFGRHSV